ncbi:hypothetical protein [Glaciecola petra]|uniref:Uncharacterized protein n=1 Tax=Glaciecola petra TaxID=3075602 RepID=A0ABU2ZTB2_9ALTE|nr:hypothetical protein [Aestuariibacter sp. P117]MDT0595554.1 hypothetical protein [Aestuariibacter sp. P117]
MKSTQKNPTKMFATAALVSTLMMFIISAVFAEASAPCLNAYERQNKVIIDTSHHQGTQATLDKPIGLCNRNDQQIGWLTWIFKQTDAADFHYLDLLELLSRK